MSGIACFEWERTDFILDPLFYAYALSSTNLGKLVVNVIRNTRNERPYNTCDVFSLYLHIHVPYFHNIPYVQQTMVAEVQRNFVTSKRRLSSIAAHLTAKRLFPRPEVLPPVNRPILSASEAPCIDCRPTCRAETIVFSRRKRSRLPPTALPETGVTVSVHGIITLDV